MSEQDQQAPKRRGRPPGTVLPPEQRKGTTLHVRVTDVQAQEWERRGGADWLRKSLNRRQATTPQARS